jgi:hypothetical protein
MDKRKFNAYDGIINNTVNIIQTTVEARKDIDIRGVTRETIQDLQNYLKKIVQDASQIIATVERLERRENNDKMAKKVTDKGTEEGAD